jgi:hypothetical protein
MYQFRQRSQGWPVRRSHEYAAAVAIAVALASMSPDTASPQSYTASDGWTVLRPSNSGFHVRIPPDWREDDTPTPDVLSLRPRRPDAISPNQFVNCKAGAVVNPATEALTQEMLDASVAANPIPPNVIREILSAIGNHAVVRNNDTIPVAAHPSYFIVVAATKATIHVVAAEVLLVRPGWLYNMACTAGARTAEQAEEAWNQWNPTFMQMFTTFDSDVQAPHH